jgi:hypothetical protein
MFITQEAARLSFRLDDASYWSRVEIATSAPWFIVTVRPLAEPVHFDYLFGSVSDLLDLELQAHELVIVALVGVKPMNGGKAMQWEFIPLCKVETGDDDVIVTAKDGRRLTGHELEECDAPGKTARVVLEVREPFQS